MRPPGVCPESAAIVGSGAEAVLYRSLLVHLEGGSPRAVAVEVAQRLARRFEAHLVGLAPTGRLPTSVGFAVAAAMGDAAEAARVEGRRRADAFVATCGAAGLTSVEGIADAEDAVVSLVRHARFSDLVVLGQGEDAEARAVVEHVVLACARPVLVLPCGDAPPTLGERILVAWNDSAEAARAVADAMPLLRRAREVTVLRCEAPGAALDDLGGALREELEALGRWLAWHGVEAQPRLEVSGTDAGNALLSRAADLGSDLLVMGAWGRSRWTERMLGGATRTLLHGMTIPTLMSH